ncbi:hypothetical protein D0861_04150 [Hortaea werneckii]|uniref:Uncharacterized protein n=1 Tax=Hortaea werneckii TaxID=91943 RepID=A0A3M7FL91_HORWE|nr:hypothetical protein D0861_04150 [Hortaea werneckii]
MSKDRQPMGPASGATTTRCFKSLSGLTSPTASALPQRRQTLWQRMKKQCSPVRSTEAPSGPWRKAFRRLPTTLKGPNKRLQKKPRSRMPHKCRSQSFFSSESNSDLRTAAAFPVFPPKIADDQAGSNPTPDTKVKKRHSIFGISGLLQAFSFEVEKSFLTPVEKRILQHLHVVSSEGCFQSSRTLAPARLVMPDEDSSEALQAIQALTRHYSINDKEILCRDLDRLLTQEQRNMLRKTLYSHVEICCQQSNRFVSPEAYQREGTAQLRIRQGPVRAVTFAEASQRPPPRNALHDATPPAGEIVIRHDIEISRDSSCLRGGGGEETSGTTFNLFDLGRRPKPLKDDQRPHPAIWWLAGGKINPRKPGWGVPTALTLRERRVVEDANREKVGFLGTLVGLRRVEVTRRQLREACNPLLKGPDKIAAAGSGEVGNDAKEQAASVVPEAPDICGAAGSTEAGTQKKL